MGMQGFLLKLFEKKIFHHVYVSILQHLRFLNSFSFSNSIQCGLVHKRIIKGNFLGSSSLELMWASAFVSSWVGKESSGGCSSSSTQVCRIAGRRLRRWRGPTSRRSSRNGPRAAFPFPSSIINGKFYFVFYLSCYSVNDSTALSFSCSSTRENF